LTVAATARNTGRSVGVRKQQAGRVNEEGAMLTTGRVQDAIDTMFEEGRSFVEIEDFISDHAISEEFKRACGCGRGPNSRQW
jgi:hypothetical protein